MLESPKQSLQLGVFYILELIETWLSAHFYATRDPRPVDEKAGSVSQQNQSKVDLGFNNSHYGQDAMTVDTSGWLGRLNNKIKKGGRSTAGVTSLATLTDSQTTALEADDE